MEYFFQGSKIWVSTSKLTHQNLSHLTWYQYVTKTHSWWVEMLYVSQNMLQSKLIFYKIILIILQKTAK